eukprot:9475846-Heterocapsa_arctica.AAC.1
MEWSSAKDCPALAKWRKIEACTPDQWLAPAILGHLLHSYSELIDNLHEMAFGAGGELLGKLAMNLITDKRRTTGVILERHLSNAMTAVVSHAVSTVMSKGVQSPREGKCG